MSEELVQETGRIVSEYIEEAAETPATGRSDGNFQRSGLEKNANSKNGRAIDEKANRL
jgi:hypothetical protein